LIEVDAALAQHGASQHHAVLQVHYKNWGTRHKGELIAQQTQQT